jgi:short-subunit dehydrogenase
MARVVVIIGASGDVGRGIALTYALNPDYKLVLVGRNESPLLDLEKKVFIVVIDSSLSHTCLYI